MKSDCGQPRWPWASAADERAVSPVVGTVLVIAIAVTLAAVIGTFAVRLGQNANEEAPTSLFEANYDGSASSLTVTFTDGNTLQRNRLSWVVTGGDGSYSGGGFSGSGRLSPGDEATLGGVQPTETVRLVWETAEGNRETTLLTWTGPDA